jgi:hypothetical protein
MTSSVLEGGWVGPKTGINTVKREILLLPGIETWLFSPQPITIMTPYI